MNLNPTCHSGEKVKTESKKCYLGALPDPRRLSTTLPSAYVRDSSSGASYLTWMRPSSSIELHWRSVPLAIPSNPRLTVISVDWVASNVGGTNYWRKLDKDEKKKYQDKLTLVKTVSTTSNADCTTLLTLPPRASKFCATSTATSSTAACLTQAAPAPFDDTEEGGAGQTILPPC